MDSIVIDGVPLRIYPCRASNGRWSFDCETPEVGVFVTVVSEIIEGLHAGWVEGIRERQDLMDEHVYADRWVLSERRSLPEDAPCWSRLGGSKEGEDCYVLGIAVLSEPSFVIPTPALIQLLTVLLERSGLDATKTPPPLMPFDSNAEYAQLPDPPKRPPPPLKENKRLLERLDESLGRLTDLQKKDSAAAHQARVAVLNEMKELGILREDLIGSHDAGIAGADRLSRFLSKIDELRKYYASAHRKSALGTTSIPNTIGGPLSYQLIDQTRSWDFGDHHPHEIFAQLESIMRKQSNLEGDFGERKVEDGTFKATFHWEREDGIHASLTKVIVESW